ncbi:MAG: N-6 DNA methylase [Bacteroidales bacterium]|nr:N-6 DNA methylase [Bacteroidales bacterium]
MQRLEIIEKIGKEYLVSNIENGEFSYQQEIKRKLSGHYKLDIRFFNEKMNLAVLVETKQNFKDDDKEQLFSYVKLEQELKTLKIIAILANTNNNKIKVWKILNGKEYTLDDTKLKSFEEYNNYFKKRNINDKTTVLENTSQLNNLLHDNGIDENLRSQFVGTCLLALKNGLVYKDNTTNQIIAGIKEQLEIILAANSSLEKSEKLNVLWKNVLQSQTVRSIESNHFSEILDFIEENILPYIDEYSNEGQDILSYFFTTFNKYVGRKDKNQAFTPNHIAHFMCKVGRPRRNTRVLDPTCGSGTFLVQAMTQILSYCETEEERNNVKKNQIYGIEYDETVYGLSTTNMLIHSDGNSNIKNSSCFDLGDWIEESEPNLVLMNPPYNASKKHVTKEFAKRYGSSSTDPSKGFFFVNFVANHIKQGKLITLLPMSCAITTNGIIKEFKEKMLENNTLEAVFSFPSEMFYPGASAVACCMVFNLGRPHTKDDETFFGYYKEDGFEKRKGVGRIDVKGWKEIEEEWLRLYEHKLTKVGMSVTKHVTAEDEWCAEAYMETDYSTLTERDFILKLRDYAAFLVQTENF